MYLEGVFRPWHKVFPLAVIRSIKNETYCSAAGSGVIHYRNKGFVLAKI